MCKYCEPITRTSDGENEKLPIPCQGECSNDNRQMYPIVEWTIGQVVGSTPISRRRHRTDNLKGELQVVTELDCGFKTEVKINIPIAYCPFCGKQL